MFLVFHIGRPLWVPSSLAGGHAFSFVCHVLRFAVLRIHQEGGWCEADEHP